MGTSKYFVAALLFWCAPTFAAVEPDQSGSVVTSPGVSIHYERYGNGPTVILVPNRMFMPEFAALARPDRTLILYDMRNRGQSGPVEDERQLTILGDVEDVEALRKHFRAERISLVGYSYLGLMVAAYAAQYPERVERIVQIGAVPRKFGTPYPADQQAGADSLSIEGQAARANWQRVSESTADAATKCRAFAQFVSHMIVVDPANAAKVPDTCRYENESVANAQRHLRHHFADIRSRDFPREPFTKLRQPVLTIHGLLDRNAPYGAGLEWASTFPNARLVTVPRGAHQLWLDDPSVIGEIDRFLAGQWPERALRLGGE